MYSNINDINDIDSKDWWKARTEYWEKTANFWNESADFWRIRYLELIEKNDKKMEKTHV